MKALFLAFTLTLSTAAFAELDNSTCQGFVKNPGSQLTLDTKMKALRILQADGDESNIYGEELIIDGDLKVGPATALLRSNARKYLISLNIINGKITSFITFDEIYSQDGLGRFEVLREVADIVCNKTVSDEIND